MACVLKTTGLQRHVSMSSITSERRSAVQQMKSASMSDRAAIVKAASFTERPEMRLIS
jgi:hypothetical protein